MSDDKRFFLALDCNADVCEPWFDSAYRSENAVPARVWHGIVRRWACADLKEHAQERFLSEHAATFARVFIGVTVEWDGNNHVGRAEESAVAAIQKIEDALAEYGNDQRNVRHVWDAADWFQGHSAESLGISASTTDEELDAIIDKLKDEAEATTECDELKGSVRYLYAVRDRLAEGLDD